jgi:hypothetical protein
MTSKYKQKHITLTWTKCVILCFKEHHQEGEKTADRVGELLWIMPNTEPGPLTC